MRRPAEGRESKRKGFAQLYETRMYRQECHHLDGVFDVLAREGQSESERERDRQGSEIDGASKRGIICAMDQER